MVGDQIGYLDFWVRTKLPAWPPCQYIKSSANITMRTAEEQLLGCLQEFLLLLRAGHWVEPSHSDDPLDRVSRSIIGVRVCPQNTAEVCFKPVLFSRLQLVASLIDTVAFYGARYLHLYSHIHSGERIVAALEVSKYPTDFGVCTHQYSPETTLFCLSKGRFVKVLM